MSQLPFSQVLRKKLSLSQGGRPFFDERPAAPATATKADDRHSSARRTNVLYLVGDARETKFVSGSFDKAFPHLILDFSADLGEARHRLAEQGRYDTLMLGWSVPEAEAVSLIGYVRGLSYPLAVVAAHDGSPEGLRQAGADECVQKGASFLACLPGAIEEALLKRGTAAAASGKAPAPASTPAPAPAPAPAPRAALRVAYAGDVEFVKTALKGAASPLQFIALADTLDRSACDIVVMDHTPAANTATVLAGVRSRNLDVPIVLLVSPSDEGAAFRTFAADVDEFIVKTPGWATRLPLRLDIASSRHQHVRELAALRVKEARLRSLVDNLPASIVRLTPEGTILAANALALSCLGATESRQLLRKQFVSLVNPAGREACSNFIARVCAGEHHSIEVAVTTLSGEGRVLGVRAIPISADVGGGTASMLTVLHDITDLKRLETSVEQVTHAPSPVAAPSVHAIERFDGSSEVFQSEKAAVADPGVLRELEADLQRLSGRARTAFEELEASLREAEARHEQVSAAQLEQQAKQLEAQAKLASVQAARWRSFDEFVHAAAHGIFHATLANDLLDLNQAFATTLGYGSPDDLIAEGTSIGRFTPEEEWRAAVDRWRHDAANEPVEVRWKTKDGVILTLRLRGQIVMNPHGDGERLEVIVENVTAQRALEAQLRRARKWEDVARVTTGIAADLKHLVGSMCEAADRFMEGLSPGDADRPDATAIQQTASKALSLSRQLVAFGRKEARAPEPLDLNAVVQALDGMIRRVADEHIELVIDLAPHVEPIQADQPTVEDALVTLTKAACDVLPAGGRIAITTANVDVERHDAEHPPGVEPGSYVLLSMAAAGWGMNGDLSRNPLSSTEHAIGRLGGCLKLEAVPTESLTFRVYLPHAQTAEAVES